MSSRRARAVKRPIRVAFHLRTVLAIRLFLRLLFRLRLSIQVTLQEHIQGIHFLDVYLECVPFENQRFELMNEQRAQVGGGVGSRTLQVGQKGGHFWLRKQSARVVLELQRSLCQILQCFTCQSHSLQLCILKIGK